VNPWPRTEFRPVPLQSIADQCGVADLYVRCRWIDEQR
jgi:hypothetical protein